MTHAHANSPGRFTFETRESIRRRVWAPAPAPHIDIDATSDIRELRTEDAARADEAAERKLAEDPDAGTALLTRLGLE